MAGLQEAAVQAVELDAFADTIPDLVFSGTSAYSLFKSRAKQKPIANDTSAGGVTRPSFRLPFRVQSGASISQGTGDGDSIGSGSGSQWQGFALSPVFLISVCQISWLAQNATRGKQRGLVNVQAEELKNSLDSAMQGIEGLISNGDGTGTVDFIPSTATINNNTGSGQQTSSIEGLNVAAAFSDQQVVQVFPSGGGEARGTFTISYVDATTQKLYSAGALPTGTAVGDTLAVNGSSGAAGSSLLGIKAWDVNSNTGTIGGLSRANFPGRLSTPVINLDGGPITQGVSQRAQVLLSLALGPKNQAMKSALWYGSVQQAAAISNLWYSRQISQNLEKGDSVPDMARKSFIETFGGREYHASATFDPSRVDLLLMDNWTLGTLADLELYDFGGGQTVMPVPDTSSGGTYKTASMFAYSACIQLGNSAPRAGLFVEDIAIPQI
jgi:hypothetical protein